MTQQYGFRATNNLSEVLDRDECWDNLGIDRRDLMLLLGTSAAGVSAADYQAIIGLESGLENQIVTATGFASSRLAEINQRAVITGGTFSGNIIASVDNDRPYVTTAGSIIGPSTVSYFSPTASGLYATGAEYKLGPLTAGTVTASGFNYVGSAKTWSNYFSRYKNYLRIQEQPSWTVRQAPLYLPPPNAIDGCVVWLDSEFSNFVLDGSGNIQQWKGVGNTPTAFQEVAASRPSYVPNVLNGKPAVRFDGSNDFFQFSDIGSSFPGGATLVCKVRIEDGDYNIFGTLNNVNNRWNNGTGQGTIGIFTTGFQIYGGPTNFVGFPNEIDSNGTMVFSIRISQNYGLEMRENSRSIAFKQSSTFTYTGGNTFFIGKSGGATGYFRGDIYGFTLFNRVLSDKEVRTVEEYFAWRYDAIYDPDRTQQLQLEDFSSIDLENGTPLIA